MTINNKDLYNLYKSVKIDYDNGIYGLYLEGFQGGVNAYVTDGKAAFKKTFYGDNKKVFVSYCHKWQKKDGATDIKDLTEKDERNFLPKIKAYFESERFNAFTVDGKEFKQAVKAVDAINRGEKSHHIVLSFHNGKFDIASWSGEDTAFWQLDGDYLGDGAVMVNKKYLDGVKADKLELSYGKDGGSTILYLTGEMNAVILPLKLDEDDQKMFLEVLEYEYNAPEKIAETESDTVTEPELKLVTSEKPRKETVVERKTRKPRTPRIKPKKQLISDIAFIRKYTGTYFT